MINRTHLNALELRRHNETMRLANSKTEHEMKLRSAWIAQINKEISEEYKFLGLVEVKDTDYDLMSLDDILAELEL